jgi:hypothetical protein
VIVWCGAAVVAVGGEWLATGFDDAGAWLLDLVTGATLLAAGIVASERRPDPAAGPLLGAAGVARFAGGVSGVASFWHRGPLAHALLARALGDPSLEVGYASPEGFRDEHGRLLPPPAPGRPPAVLAPAVLDHDAGAIGDSRHARRRRPSPHPIRVHGLPLSSSRRIWSSGSPVACVSCRASARCSPGARSATPTGRSRTWLVRERHPVARESRTPCSPFRAGRRRRQDAHPARAAARS